MTAIAIPQKRTEGVLAVAAGAAFLALLDTTVANLAVADVRTDFAGASVGGATWLITTGGPQSNHARLTAAAAAKLGMGCSVFLRGAWQGPPAGSLLLDQLFGAAVQLLGEVDYAAADHGSGRGTAAADRRTALHHPFGWRDGDWNSGLCPGI